MEMESPCLEEKELIVFPSSKVMGEEEYFTLEHKMLNKSNNKTSNKRRLVITTMSIEPILIEIRPNLPEPLIYPLASNSTQCNIIDNRCHCIKTISLEHMNLWNELNQILHDSNAFKFSEDHWFEKEANDSFFDGIKMINCRDLWPNISAKALQSIKNLKKEIEIEKDERERYALALTKFSDLEEQLEMEKNMRIQESNIHDAIILELRNQVTKQAEEIRRLWTENLAIENDSVNLKLDENKHQEDVLETKQCILELERQLIEESKKYKITFTNQEAKCEFLQSKVDKLENKQAELLLDENERDNLKLKIEELEKENMQYQEEVILSSFRKEGDDKILDYATLQKEYDMLKDELEKTNCNYKKTTNKLRHNVAKRRRLEAESEGEKQQRSNLAAALYELESEVEATIATINLLQSTTLESISALTIDLQNFQEALEKCADSNDFKIKSSSQNDNEIIKSFDNINEQSLIQNLEVMNSNSNTFKGISGTKHVISKLIQENEKLLKEIFDVRVVIRQVSKTYKCQVHATKKEMMIKLETIEAEKETFRRNTKVLDEENKNLEEENSKLRHEVSTLKSAKSKLALELKDLDNEIEDVQENLKNLREENRKLLKEAKWKSVGKQGGYQESLIVQEWEKKLKKLEVDYDILRHIKKDLVKEKHHLQGELDRAVEKGYKGLAESEGRKLEDELFNMTQERNKLRKIKITLAIENVSLKESLAELNTKTDALQLECETLREWKEKVQKLEEDCEDLRDWKSKAEALEVECKDLRDNQMKVEAYEIECKVKNNSKEEEVGEKCKNIYESIQDIGEECKDIWQGEDSLQEECKKLCEYKIHLKEECQKLHQSVDHLHKECSILCKFKENTKNSSDNNELLNSNKLDVNILECEKLSDNKNKVEVEVKDKILNQSISMDVEECSSQDYLMKIANLKHENMKLCENHQAALDKQWNVLQVDLKAFEEKVEELENECESICRDHLSSMVENAELMREKDKLLALYNEQKYNYEILETANECLQKNQEQKEAQRIRERNDYHASIDNLNSQVLKLESTFCERLHQQAANYASFLEPKTKTNRQETINLTRQEYKILLAEKLTILQERDSAHKKLCSAEVQNLQLSASIDCLRQEVPHESQGYDEKEIGTEVLLAQDVVNLRSMLSSLEEELGIANCEKNKMHDVNSSLRGELNEVRETLLHCQHENQKLNVALEELNRRTSLKQIHSAASSLKEQLGKASKEKDLIKEQLNKVIKEKEQLANVPNERDNVIFSLKKEISKLEKEKEESCSSFKVQLQNMEDNTLVPSHIQDQLILVVKERDNIKEDLAALQIEIESLYSKMSIVEKEQIKKTELWQKDHVGFEEKYKKIEMELNNTKDLLAMTKKTMQNNIEEAIEEKNNFKLATMKRIEDAHAQSSQFHDELLQMKQFLSEKIEIASKEMENVIAEKNIGAQEMMEYKEKNSLLQKENETLTNLVEEKDKLIVAKLPLTIEQDDLLIIIANLKTEKEIIIKKFEQDLHIGMSSIKALLATTIKEKEELITNKEYLQKTIDDLCVTTKSLNEKLETFFFEKDQLLHDKEVVILERNDLLEKISSFHTCEEIRLKDDDFKSTERSSNRGLEVCENVLKNHVPNDQHVDFIKENTKYIQVSEMKIPDNLLANANFVLVQEKESFIDENNKLSKELSLLKKDNDIKSGKCHWNFENSIEKIAILLQEKEQLLVSEASLKQQLADFEKKDINNNSILMYEKSSLLRDHDNLNSKITILKKEKEEIQMKLERFLVQNATSMNDLQNTVTTTKHELLSKQEEHAILIEDYVHLKEENAMLIQTKVDLIKEHNNFIVEIGLVKKENKDLEKKLANEIIQLPLFKSELFESSREKDRLVSSELYLTQQLNMLKANATTQEQLQCKLEGEIIVLRQTIETLIQQNNKLVKECEQHIQLQNEISSLGKTKETIIEQCDSLSKEMTLLKNEKKLLVEKYAATLFEKDHVLASQLSQKIEVENLNKTLISLNKQVVDLVQKNKNLHIELQSTAIVEAKMSKDQEQQTCAPTIFKTNEIGILCNMEQCVNQMNAKFNKENKQVETILSPITTTFPNNELVSLNKQLKFLKHQQNEIIKERDNLASLLKEKEQSGNSVDSYKMEIEILKQKLDLFNQQQAHLSQEKNNMLQCNNLQAKISTLKVEGDIMNSSAESEVTKHEVSKERFQKHQIASLQLSVKTLKEQQTNLTKENMEIAVENEVLTKERNCLFASISLLKKQHEVVCVQELKKKETTIIEASLNKKFEELVQIVNTLSQNQEGHALQKEIKMQSLESSKEEHLNLLETIRSPEENQVFSGFEVEHHVNQEISHPLVVKEYEVCKVQASLKAKLDDLAKTTTSLTKGLIASMKENEQLVLEITSLKQECQKLHMTLINSEKDKDTLMKKVIESRSTFDRCVGEISRLQRESTDVEMKLRNAIVEKDNAKLQIANLQMHLNNQQRVQHLPISYSLEKVQTLEAQNRCLRMEKDVLEECLNKRSMELDGNHRFKQHVPSMTNFNCTNQQPPSHHLLHTSSQLFLSGSNALGRPQPSLFPILHQQWPA